MTTISKWVYVDGKWECGMQFAQYRASVQVRFPILKEGLAEAPDDITVFLDGVNAICVSHVEVDPKQVEDAALTDAALVGELRREAEKKVTERNAPFPAPSTPPKGGDTTSYLDGNCAAGRHHSVPTGCPPVDMMSRDGMSRGGWAREDVRCVLDDGRVYYQPAYSQNGWKLFCGPLVNERGEPQYVSEIHAPEGTRYRVTSRQAAIIDGGHTSIWCTPTDRKDPPWHFVSIKGWDSHHPTEVEK